MKNHVWWWWTATGLHRLEQQHASGGLDFWCGWRPPGAPRGSGWCRWLSGPSRATIGAPGASAAVPALPCSTGAAASAPRTGRSPCRGRRCGTVRGRESWESPAGGRGLHRAARPRVSDLGPGTQPVAWVLVLGRAGERRRPLLGDVPEISPVALQPPDLARRPRASPRLR